MSFVAGTSSQATKTSGKLSDWAGLALVLGGTAALVLARRRHKSTKASGP